MTKKFPTSSLSIAEKKAIVKGLKARAKTKDKLPGGKAEGMETMSFSPAERKAIARGAKIEEEEHGPLAPTEIAKDHVAELGSKYYSKKEGLPAMEKKLEKAVQAKPAHVSEFSDRPPPHGTVKGLHPIENLQFSRAHQKLASQHAIAGNKESAMYHQKQAKLYWDAHLGNETEHPVHEITSKSEPTTLEKCMTNAIKGLNLLKKTKAAKEEKDPDADEVDHESEMEKHERKYDESMGKSIESMQKGDVVGIKTGKKIPVTQKRIANQPTGTNSGHPTPSPVKPSGEIGTVSDKVADKFAANRENQGFKQKLQNKVSDVPQNYPGPGPTWDKKIARMKMGLDKLNALSGELKSQNRDFHVVKSTATPTNLEKAWAGHGSSLLQTTPTKPTTASKKPTEPKPIQYASGLLSKSINSDCDKCGSKQHKQWCDTAKSESCTKCGTPLSKSGTPEEMPDEVKNLSKASNAVKASEAEELKKFDSTGVSSIKNAFGGGDAPAPAPTPTPSPEPKKGWFDKANSGF